MAKSEAHGPLMIQSISNIKIIEFTTSQLLDQIVIDKVHDELTRVIQTAGHPKLVISFEGVNAISSSMLGTLISLHNEAKKHKGEIRLAHIAPSLMQVFKLTNLNRLLSIYDNTDKALRKF